jgi:MarR family transcriptional regulator for hemolysin
MFLPDFASWSNPQLLGPQTVRSADRLVGNSPAGTMPGVEDRAKAGRRSAAEHGRADLGWSLGVVLRGYQNAIAEVLGELPQQARGFQILATVVHGDQPTQQALAAHLGIDRTVMTYVIDDLVEAGLVERLTNPGDRRARKIVATEHGAAILAELEHSVREVEDQILGSLDTAERETLRALVNRVACGIRQIDPMTDACAAVEQLSAESASLGE